MKPQDSDDTADGRRLRSQASRDRIIAAVIALIDQRGEPPGAEDIAAAAGVGLRSVFRHFGDMDSLYAAVLDRISRRYANLLAPFGAGSWQDQLREARVRRTEMFQTALGYRLAADMYRAGSETMRSGRRTYEQMLRSRLEALVPADVRSDTLWFEQLDLWLNIESYASLRERRGMDHAAAIAVISAAVELLIAAKSEGAAG